MSSSACLKQMTAQLEQTEDLFRLQKADELQRPVILDVRGEDSIPYELSDAMRLIDESGTGPLTRAPISYNSITVLKGKKKNWIETMSILFHLITSAPRADMLMAAGGLLTYVDADGNTPLHTHIRKDNREMVNWLLEIIEKKSIEQANGQASGQASGQTSVHENVIRALSVRSKNASGGTPLMFAIAGKNPQLIDQICRLDPMAVFDVDIEGATPLVVALRRDDRVVIRKLVFEYGAPIITFPTTSPHRSAPLLWAMPPLLAAVYAHKTPSLLRFLIEECSIHQGMDEALFKAVQFRNLAQVSLFIRCAKKNPELLSKVTVRKALRKAVQSDDIRCTRALLQFQHYMRTTTAAQRTHENNNNPLSLLLDDQLGAGMPSDAGMRGLFRLDDTLMRNLLKEAGPHVFNDMIRYADTPDIHNNSDERYHYYAQRTYNN